MQAAYEKFRSSKGKSGKEWQYLTNGTTEDYERFWELRSFFNPSEASVLLTLEEMEIPFLGGIANDVTLPSMLHDLGMQMKKTKVSEDFVAWSSKYECPIFIQCKSSGGGRKRHGKNIQNRAKEQVGRGIMYRCRIEKDEEGNSQLISRGKWYHWISVLDGDWGVTKRYPLKYVHMLQIAGYDKLIPADSLIDESCELMFPNPLSYHLKELECEVTQEEFNRRMKEFSIGEEKTYVFQSKIN